MYKFAHMELSPDEPEVAKRFYAELLGWKFVDYPMGEGHVYSMVEGVGGIGPKQNPGEPTAWLGYIDVPSLDETVAKARELGATVFVDRMEVPGMGWFSVMQDPAGAKIAFWQSARPPAPEKPAKKAKKAAKKKDAKKAKKKDAKGKKDGKKGAKKKRK